MKMTDYLNLDALRMAMLAAGFEMTAESRGVLSVDADDARIDRAFCRGVERLRVRYVNPDGKKGTAYLAGINAVVEMFVARNENFKRMAMNAANQLAHFRG
jgi:hypothetical protein